MVEALSRRGVDNPCCLEENRGRGGFARVMQGKDSRHKILWNGNNSDNSNFVRIGLSST